MNQLITPMKKRLNKFRNRKPVIFVELLCGDPISKDI